ncbi:hypothetical protein GCM10020331_033740 [Ectobacillus funiculus]
MVFNALSAGGFASVDISLLLMFYGGLLLYTIILHRNLFDWKPKAIATYTNNAPVPTEAISDKVVVIVIDGMRKDRFDVAHTPYLDSLRKKWYGVYKYGNSVSSSDSRLFLVHVYRYVLI